MSDPRRPSLFDLPLEPPEEPRDPATPEEPRNPRRGTRKPPPATPATPATAHPRPEDGLPLFPDEPVSPDPDDPHTPTPGRPPAEPADSTERPTRRAPRETPESPAPPERVSQPPAPMPASLGSRWRAGGLDLLLHAVLALVLAVGSSLLGAPLEGFEILGLVVFVAVFSFLYTVIPLAFWGRTLGMSQAGLVASGGDPERSALTFGQTALRWLGGVLTLTLLGLPTLLALLGGRSLTDRLSGSRTWRLPRSGDR